MNIGMDILLVFLILTNFGLLGSSVLSGCIRIVAAQGIVLGLLPLLILNPGESWRAGALAVVAMGLKGVVFPWLLSRAVREARVRREMEPFIGYSLSLVLGILALWFSYRLGSRLILPVPGVSAHILPAALFTMFVGLFLIISRRKALVQVLGYLVLENGIYALGLVLVGQIHFLVELGVLLDVFVAVFVMGIAIYQMNREFDHIDVDLLDRLKG